MKTMPIGGGKKHSNNASKAAGETIVVKDEAILHSSTGEDSEKGSRNKLRDRNPKYDLSVTADVHKTGKILNLKHTRVAAIKEGNTNVPKMTL